MGIYTWCLGQGFGEGRYAMTGSDWDKTVVLDSSPRSRFEHVMTDVDRLQP
jgi:hypothetical protein